MSPAHTPVPGERGQVAPILSWREKSGNSAVMGVRLNAVVSIFTCDSLSLLYNVVINVVAVTVHFLVSLLFPVNRSHPNL